MPTMEDIANRLSISKGTVSKALNGAPDVSETLRKTIVETAVEMGYTRIQRAGGRRLCVLTAHMAYQRASDFGYDLILGFRKLAEPAGFQVDVVPVTEELQQTCGYDAFMLKNDYAGGFVLGLSPLDPWMDSFSSCRTPTVLFDSPAVRNPLVSSVSVDNFEAMDQAVALLKGLGHQTIGYLGGLPHSYIFQVRQTAFFEALRNHGLRDDPGLSGTASHASECLETHFQRLCDMGCSAIVCSHDLLASALLVYCEECGISVPRDLSVIGMDDIPLSRHTNPPLTTIRQNRPELGRCAFFGLSGLLSKVPVSRVLLHPELVRRTSVAAVGESGPGGGPDSGANSG